MYRITLLETNEYLTELHSSVYAARRAVIEHITSEIMAQPGGARTLFRMGGRVSWKSIEHTVHIGLVTGEWIVLVEGDEVPEQDIEMDNVVFIEKKNQMRHLGHWDAESGYFVDGCTDKMFAPSKVSAYLIMPDEVDDAQVDDTIEDFEREPTGEELAEMEKMFDEPGDDEDKS